MLSINCPKCDHLIDDLGEVLPANACDDVEIECPECYHEFLIGWRAEVELR